jgi:hypothetical protein
LIAEVLIDGNYTVFPSLKEAKKALSALVSLSRSSEKRESIFLDTQDEDKVNARKLVKDIEVRWLSFFQSLDSVLSRYHSLFKFVKTVLGFFFYIFFLIIFFVPTSPLEEPRKLSVEDESKKKFTP